MNYEAFKIEYLKAFNSMMSYSPDQVGSGHFAEKMADLYEINPDWADQVEEEAE